MNWRARRSSALRAFPAESLAGGLLSEVAWVPEKPTALRGLHSGFLRPSKDTNRARSYAENGNTKADVWVLFANATSHLSVLVRVRPR